MRPSASQVPLSSCSAPNTTFLPCSLSSDRCAQAVCFEPDGCRPLLDAAGAIVQRPDDASCLLGGAGGVGKCADGVCLMDTGEPGKPRLLRWERRDSREAAVHETGERSGRCCVWEKRQTQGSRSNDRSA